MESVPVVDVSLVKQWFWCPRYVYLRYVLGIPEPMFEYVREGRDFHRELTVREEVRKSLLLRPTFRFDRKLLQVRVRSIKYGLTGVLDMLVIRQGRPIPVEIKLTACGKYVPIHHKAQLMAYALCLEEMFGKSITEGYIYYVRDDKLVYVKLSDDLRRVLLIELEKLRQCLRGVEVPARCGDYRKCSNCWFVKYCNSMSF